VSDRSRERSDGVRIVATPGVRKSVWLIAGAMSLAALAVLVLALTARGPLEATAPLPPAPQPPAQVAAAAPPREAADGETAASRHARRITRPEAEPPAPPADPAPARPALPPSRDDVPFSLGRPGVKSGIELFPAPGTKPTKIGIVVPDDFELPEGYVRHFQATDDGELLPAVLLFHPDYEWVDDVGNVIELPADRVVPPELAPPGLPIQMLELQSAPDAAR
jgi:hypothetical protein